MLAERKQWKCCTLNSALLCFGQSTQSKKRWLSCFPWKRLAFHSERSVWDFPVRNAGMQSSVQSWPRESRLKREPHNTHICLHFQSIHLPLDQLKREKQEGKYKKDQNWRFTSDIGREENTTLCLKKQNTILSNVIFFSFDLEPENTDCAKHENTRISLSSGPMLLKTNKWRGKYMLHIFKQSVTKSGPVLHRWISSDKSETGATFTFLFLSQRIF